MLKASHLCTNADTTLHQRCINLYLYICVGNSLGPGLVCVTVASICGTFFSRCNDNDHNNDDFIILNKLLRFGQGQVSMTVTTPIMVTSQYKVWFLSSFLEQK